MGFLDELARGVAKLLDQGDVGTWVPGEQAIPTGLSGAVIVVGLSPAAPDQAVTVTVYGVEDTLDGHGTYGVQVRSRGWAEGAGSAADLDDAAFAVLQRPRGVTVEAPGGDLHVASLYRRSGPAPMGQDQNGRVELTSNYYALVGRAAVEPWS